MQSIVLEDQFLVFIDAKVFKEGKKHGFMLKVSGCCTPPSHLSRPGAIEIGIHILIWDSEVPRFEPVFDNDGQNDEISYFVGWILQIL